MAKGSDAVRAYYDARGWQAEGTGPAFDEVSHGHPGAGPIAARMSRRRMDRLKAELGRVDRLLECGCGGNPEPEILPLCSHYTGVDFSETGLALAEKKLAGKPHELRRADVCALPFPDANFDAVYCANVIYHLPDPEAQRTALREMARVLKPGGLAIIIAANPRPLLFPGRMAVRMIADSPLGPIANRLRPRPPLDYLPMPRRWMRDALSPFGSVEEKLYALPSVWMRQHTPERGPGRLIWRALEIVARTDIPALGCYVQFSLRRGH